MALKKMRHGSKVNSSITSWRGSSMTGSIQDDGDYEVELKRLFAQNGPPRQQKQSGKGLLNSMMGRLRDSKIGGMESALNSSNEWQAQFRPESNENMGSFMQSKIFSLRKSRRGPPSQSIRSSIMKMQTNTSAIQSSNHGDEITYIDENSAKVKDSLKNRLYGSKVGRS